MDSSGPSARIAKHLRVLAEDVGARPPGSPANRRATDYLTAVLAEAGFDPIEQPFDTLWWTPGDGTLTTATGTIRVDPNPYSQATTATGRVARLDRWSDLVDAARFRDRVLVLAGELTHEQVMPSAFPFYNPDDHRRLVAFLHDARPAAVVAVSDHWAPVFEDPELPFPSTTLPTATAAELGSGLHADAEVTLSCGGRTSRGDGVNVVARTPGDGPKLVLSAHVDSKVTTPGAFDNAASVATLLALAEDGIPAEAGPVELVFFNGEDHYDAAGEKAYLAGCDLDDVLANVNVDGLGVAGRRSSVAFLACPAAVETHVADLVASDDGWMVADPWFESDHAIFAMQEVPALAITSEQVHDLLATIAHTPEDTVDKVDVGVLVDAVTFLGRLLPLLRRTTPVSDH